MQTYKELIFVKLTGSCTVYQSNEGKIQSHTKHLLVFELQLRDQRGRPAKLL